MAADSGFGRQESVPGAGLGALPAQWPYNKWSPGHISTAAKARPEHMLCQPGPTTARGPEQPLICRCDHSHVLCHVGVVWGHTAWRKISTDSHEPGSCPAHDQHKAGQHDGRSGPEQKMSGSTSQHLSAAGGSHVRRPPLMSGAHCCFLAQPVLVKCPPRHLLAHGSPGASAGRTGRGAVAMLPAGTPWHQPKSEQWLHL